MFQLIKKFLKIFPPVRDFAQRINAIESMLYKHEARLNHMDFTFNYLADHPSYTNEELSFNSQVKRRELTTQILNQMRPAAIVETGTCLGNTTGYFTQFNVPVISSEISSLFYFAAKQRLQALPHVQLRNCDSRGSLKRLVEEKVHLSLTFFYLDAHWYDDLPLLEEIKIINTHWANYIILIDDFQVPHDAGYRYDDYGETKVLDYSYIENYVKENLIQVFFPTIPASEETGKKRGYVYLAKGDENVALLTKLAELSQYSEADPLP